MQYVFNIKDPGSRLTRFRLKLEEYNYELVYKAGKINTNADSLSRIISTVNKNTITNYANFQEHLQSHIIINSNVKEKSTNNFHIHGPDPAVLFIPKKFNKDNFKSLENNQDLYKFLCSFTSDVNINTPL